jgi:hypothetical protein
MIRPNISTFPTDDQPLLIERRRVYGVGVVEVLMSVTPHSILLEERSQRGSVIIPLSLQGMQTLQASWQSLQQ